MSINFLFKHFARRIVIDVHPSRFTFTCSKDNVCRSIPTFVYVDNGHQPSRLAAIGTEIPSEYLEGKEIRPIELFDMGKELPPKTSFSREALIELVFGYEIAKMYEKDWFPKLRPIVFLTGSERFRDYFANPKEVFGTAAKRGGAKEVLFDVTDLPESQAA